jgi:TusA-related sulfurtransferase
MKQKVLGPLGPTELEALPLDAVVDARGLLCPVPIARLGERVKDLPPQGVVLLMNDDPAVVLDVVAWCKSTHHELLGIVKDDRDVYYCYVRKASAPPRRFEPPTR